MAYTHDDYVGYFGDYADWFAGTVPSSPAPGAFSLTSLRADQETRNSISSCLAAMRPDTAKALCEALLRQMRRDEEAQVGELHARHTLRFHGGRALLRLHQEDCGTVLPPPRMRPWWRRKLEALRLTFFNYGGV